MSAAGIGGFASGLSQGINQGFSMATAIDKDKREQAIFELQKEKLEMERDEARRKKKMNDQVARDLQAIDERLAGGVIGGEATDEFGVDLGKLIYSSPSEAKASGLKFKEDTAVKKEGEKLTDTQISQLKAAVFQKARIDHGFMDEEAFDRARKLNKELEKEGFQDAYDYFARTGDSQGAIKLYNQSGKHQAPAGAFLKREVDPVTGVDDIVVYAPNAQGQPQKITSRFEYHLSTMPDELVKYGTAMKKEKFVQGEATKRTGMEQAGANARNSATIASNQAIKGAELRAEENKALNTALNTRFTAIFRNPVSSMEADRYKVIETETGMLARNLMNAGMDMNTALNTAQDRVFKKYGINTQPLQNPTK